MSRASDNSLVGSVNPPVPGPFSMSEPLTDKEIRELLEYMPLEAENKVRNLSLQSKLCFHESDREQSRNLTDECTAICRQEGEKLNKEYWASQATAAPSQSENPQATTAAPPQSQNPQTTAAAPHSTSGSQQKESIYTRIFNAPVIGKLDVYPNR